ncbi:RT0821/Lpp0805 family surface protein [Aurantimonas sp. Leaf443]|uniref:RT0821/Lpp0805 family surface protein n=1 Tax=Aurantimonas sp. Leaf443 TaxID=1736378 RepID=UPI000701AEE0|nr:RT0821/Lpp0805 family surface protein [Aurantimonas sp. Leaf443]KQT88063.1 hypothetical protein ASG48_01005 [Aurantimonas sp. Leaf443]
MARLKPISVLLLVALGLLQGCVVAGPSLEDAVDTGLVTGSIRPVPAAGEASNPEVESDERTVRNAISAADIARLGEADVPWANSATGTSGVITAIQEVQEGGNLCRNFKTSRQRFDGIALYEGKACTRGDGEWTLVRFQENG